MAIAHFPLKLVARRMIAPTVAHLSFERDDGQPLPCIPGQFIQIHFQYADGTPARRSYSIAVGRALDAAPDARVEIAVSYVPGGAATALFEGMAIGATLDASGPFGRFCLLPNDAYRRYLPCFSRELPAAGSPHAHPDVRHGYVQNVLPELAPDPDGDIAYLCGNPDMVDASFEALKATGLPVPMIRREKYVSNK